jgi:hypothetical protein
MSKSEKTSSIPKDPSEVQGISMDEFSSTIPGVTQLLNPGLERKQSVTTAKGEKAKIHLKFGGTSPGIKRPENIAGISPKKEVPELPRETKNPSFASLGVRKIMVFSKTGNSHRFESDDPRSPEPFEAWQKEFFRGMILDPSTLSLNADFNEFSAKNAKFQADAFGLEGTDWLILMKNGSRWHALISRNQLSDRRSELENLLSQAKRFEETSGEIKIEIA